MDQLTLSQTFLVMALIAAVIADFSGGSNTVNAATAAADNDLSQLKKKKTLAICLAWFKRQLR